MESQTRSYSSKSRYSRHQEYEGQYGYKIYTSLLTQLLNSHKQTIQRYLPIQKNENYPTIVTKSPYNCPIFSRNFQEIVNSYLLKKEIYQQTIEELISCIKQQINKIVFHLKDQEIQDYQEIVEDNLKLFKQKMKKSQSQYIWTVQRMVIIDVLSSFMKINYQHRKIHQTKSYVLGNRLLFKAFDIKSENQSSLYMNQLRYNFQFIQFPYQQEFKQLILLCTIVQVKLRISNFRRKHGKKAYQKIQAQIKSFELLQFEKMQQQQENSDQNNYQIIQYPQQEYQFNFSQLIFIPYNKGEDLHNKNSLHRAQIKLLLQNIMNIDNIFKRKRQILKIKLKYSISFQSLIRFIENQKKTQNKDQVNQENLKKLEKAQWAFTRDNRKKTLSILQSILNVKLPHDTSVMRDNSLLMINLCKITMRRIALLANVNKVYHKIDKYLKRPIIYIQRLQFFYSQFSKKAQQIDKNYEDQNVFTLVLATTDREIVYAALLQSKLNDYEFSKVIKIAIKQAKLDHSSSKRFVWQHIDSLFITRHYYNLRIYFSASPMQFIMHFCIYHLIQLLINKGKPNTSTFFAIAESSAFKVINAFAGSEQARQICNQINQSRSHILDQQYSQQLEEQKLYSQFKRIYKSLLERMNKQQNLIIKVYDLFKNGKLYFFINKTQGYQEVDDNQLHHFKRLSNFEPVVGKSQLFMNKTQRYQEVDGNQLHHFKRLSNFKPVVCREEQLFVEGLISQMKCRHPYLTNSQKQMLSLSAYPILCSKNIQKKDLTQILASVVRFLLCYQVYLKQMMNQGQLKDLPLCLNNQIAFLKRLFQVEHQQTSQLFPNIIPELVSNYFCMDYFTGKYISRVFKKYQDHNLQSSQSNNEILKDTPEEQMENIKNLNNKQLKLRKK